MNQAIDNLNQAFQLGMSVRPQIGGFPYLAEALRKAGVTRNIWHLPSCQSIYLTKYGPIASQAEPLIQHTVEIPLFNREALLKALRIDQAGQSTFPEFLKAAWEAGVVSYSVDFEKRTVVYCGVLGEFYEEAYPAVEIS